MEIIKEFENETSLDFFISGKLKCYQPKVGFRAGFDSVFLAACVPAVSGQKVLDLGCGVGVSLFSLMSRVKGLVATGIEIQQFYHFLSIENSKLNSLPARLIHGDMIEKLLSLKEESFDQILLNPPFYSNETNTPCSNLGKDISHRQIGDLSEWFLLALKRCRPYGFLTIIDRPDRLPLILETVNGKGGNISVLPVVSHGGQIASRLIIRIQKSAKGDLKFHWPFIKHEKNINKNGNNNYSEVANRVLRDGAPVLF